MTKESHPEDLRYSKDVSSCSTWRCLDNVCLNDFSIPLSELVYK